MKRLDEHVSSLPRRWSSASSKQKLAALLVGVITLSLGGTGVFQAVKFSVSAPDNAYKTIYQQIWKAQNVKTMQFSAISDFMVAEASLLNAIKAPKHRENPIPYFLLAELYQVMGRSQEAVRHYQTVIRLGSHSWFHQNLYRHFVDNAHAALAIIYYDANNYARSEQEVASIRNIERIEQAPLLLALKDRLQNPKRADYHFALAKELRHALKLTKAREEFKQARHLSVDPQLKVQADSMLKTQMPVHIEELPPLVRYFSLAGESRQLKDENLAAAIQLYEEAVKGTPEFEWGYNELAILYRQTHDYEHAVANAQKAIELNPNFYNPYLTLGDIALDQAQFAEGIQYFKQAQQLVSLQGGEESLSILSNIENQLGYAYESMRDAPNAASHYRQAIKYSRSLAAEKGETDFAYAEAGLQRLAAFENATITQEAGNQQADRKHLSSL